MPSDEVVQDVVNCSLTAAHPLTTTMLVDTRSDLLVDELTMLELKHLDGSTSVYYRGKQNISIALSRCHRERLPVKLAFFLI